MRVAIVKYNAGNTASVANAVRRLGVDPDITDDAARIGLADKVIFPGVGEASSAMKYLRELDLVETLRNLQQPVLGICLGMQLLGRFSEENSTGCLEVMPHSTIRFGRGDLKVPHTGWNTIEQLSTPLFDGIDEGEHFYFVHSYFVPVGENSVATCTYGAEFAAATAIANYFAVQFHPEKSGRAGQRVLENFLNL